MTRHRHLRGQAMVEFALTATVALLVIFGTMDFALLYAGRVEAEQAVANAARYAATSPSAWDSSSTPSATSIQGRLLSTAVLAYVPNDDTHVTITYTVPGSGSGQVCGTYSASSGSLVTQNGYTQSTCLVSGTVITVQAKYVYTFATPLLVLAGQNTRSVTINVSANAVEEQ